MSSRFWIGCLLALPAASAAQPKEKDAEAERVAALVRQLSDDRFARREAATKELVAIGEKALPAIRTLFKQNDPDLRQRADITIRLILMNCRKSQATGMTFAVIDAGSFEMGAPRGARRPDEATHRVRLTAPFLMGTYEVMQAEYLKLMKVNPSWFSATGKGKEKIGTTDPGSLPVESITWFDAIEYCNRLSKEDHYPPYYKLEEVKREGDLIVAAKVTVVGGNGYRLPTEAEWEYSCRAGSTTSFHFGNQNTGKEANLKPGPPTGYGSGPDWVAPNRTTKVGSYPANAWGLYDMHGNVGEWCWDWYHRDYDTSKERMDDPVGPDKGEHRVARGGSWLVNENNARSSSRAFYKPNEDHYYLGFRVARTP
jgi:formylglycine-generating enzyme required for sulfatase activity